MAQPAAARKTSASAAPPAQPASSTSSTAAQNETKTQTHPPVPVPSSSSEQKSQNVTAKTPEPPLASSSTSTASTDAKTSGKAVESVAKSGSDASAMDRALRAQEEARRLQFALAQQQVQQYQAMTKQLEAQSGIAMTPSSTIGTSNSTTTTSVAGLAKTSEDLQKLRTEQLSRMQQNVQRQAAMAAQAVQKRTNEEWLRNKLLMEQEHLRVLRLHEQQLKQTAPAKGNNVSTATATSIADTLLAQQQQVIRQQQMLRDMLEKQQKQQHAQLQLQKQLQKGDKTSVTTTTTVNTPAKPYSTTAPSNYAAKRKLKTTFDTELEALARVCIRVANARTDSEMRQALDKMTSWLHRCTELMLLQIAHRDYRDSLAHRRPMLIQQDRWPLDLQVKSEFITQKIVQMLGAFLLREKNKIAQQEAAAKAAAATSTAVASAAAASSSTNTAATSCPATPALAASSVATPATGTAAATSATPTPAGNPVSAVTPSTAAQPNAPASTATTTTTAAIAGKTTPASTTPVNNANAAQTLPAVSAATTGTPTATTTAAPSSIILAPAVRIPVKRDMATVEREYSELKAQLQAKQVETNQKAKAKRDAAKLEASKAAGVISNSATPSAMLVASYKRPLQVEIPGSVKKPRIDSYAASSTTITTGYRPSTTSVPPISPRVAKQFYDLDLTTRTSTESEDKMYLPTKIVSKIMYSVLPGNHEEETAATRTAIKREDQAKGKTPSPAISPAHSAQENESSQDSISISDDAITFMQECVTEFLLYFTSEARDLSVMQNRRTKKGVGLSISGSNVVESMENLGFTSYARVLSGYNEKVKASQDAAARKKMERKKLIQQQALQKATAAAKAAMAANAAKSAAAAKNAVSYSYPHLGIKPAPFTRPVGTSVSTLSRPTTSMSTNFLASQAVSLTTPVRVVTPTPKPVAIPPKPVAVASVLAAQSVTTTTKPGVAAKTPTSATAATASAPTTK